MQHVALLGVTCRVFQRNGQKKPLFGLCIGGNAKDPDIEAREVPQTSKQTRKQTHTRHAHAHAPRAPAHARARAHTNAHAHAQVYSAVFYETTWYAPIIGRVFNLSGTCNVQRDPSCR